MGTRTLVGHEAGSAKPVWTLFRSADGHAMGRVLDGDEDDAQAFLDWYEPQWGDPRKAAIGYIDSDRMGDAERAALIALVKP